MQTCQVMRKDNHDLQDKELAMFVEDFIIDAYSIQLREEVGETALLIFFICYAGCTSVLALLFHYTRKQKGAVRSERLSAVL